MEAKLGTHLRWFADVEDCVDLTKQILGGFGMGGFYVAAVALIALFPGEASGKLECFSVPIASPPSPGSTSLPCVMFWPSFVISADIWHPSRPTVFVSSRPHPPAPRHTADMIARTCITSFPGY